MSSTVNHPLYSSQIIAFAELDVKGILVNCSPAFAKLLSLPKTKLVKNSLEESLREKSDLPFGCVFASFLKSNERNISRTFTIRKKEKSEISLEIILEKISKSKSSHLVHVYLSKSVKSTEIEESEREKLAIYQALISNAQAIVYAFDKRGKFLFSEGRGLADLGLKPGQVVGQSAFDIYKHNPVIINAIKGALKGESFKGIFDEGGLLFDTFLSPVYNKESQVTAVIGMSIDISERKRAEKALVESEEKYRSIFESFTDVYFRASLSGDITMVSPSIEVTLGYAPGFALRQNASLFFKDPKNWTFMVRNLVKSKELRNYEFEGIKNDGDKIFLSLTVSLTYDKELGSPNGVEGVLRDISELKMAEKEAEIKNRQLMQASKMVTLGTLVSGVTHEINNPNNYIMFNASLLSKIWKDIEPILADRYELNGDFNLGGLSYKKMLNKYADLIYGISDGAHRINKIVTELKNFVRQGTTELNQKVDINQVVLNASNLIKNLISESKVKLEMDLGWELPQIKGNRQQLEQVVINLLENSCQAAKNKNCFIKVQTIQMQNPDVVQVKVTDNGPGIKKEILHRVMDPFFTTKSDMGGTGMGLSISYNIVQDHRGTLEVSSVPNQETVFTLSFPFQ